ncbi:hypothetical protein LCGC14_2073020, partial [marine sediment metagenome]
LDKIKYLTSDNVWELRNLPKRLVVLGGGPIGAELTQTFARLGSQVTLVEMMDRIMIREDEDVSKLVRKKFEAEGVRILTGHKAKEVRVNGDLKVLICENNAGEVEIEFSEILVAVARVANTKGFGLEELGVTLRRNGTIETNGLLQTNYPKFTAAGMWQVHTSSRT